MQRKSNNTEEYVKGVDEGSTCEPNLTLAEL